MTRVRTALPLPLVALKFGAATSDRVNCGSNAELDNLDPLTLVMLVNPTTLTNSRVLLNKGITNSRWTFGLNGTSGQVFFARDRATTDCTFVTSNNLLFYLNRWRWLLCRYDSSVSPVVAMSALFLENGVWVDPGFGTSTDGSGANVSEAAGDLTIGNKADSPFNVAFQGSIAVVALYNRSLGRGDLKFLRSEGVRLLKDLNPVGLWRVGWQQKVHDESGNKNDGVITGAVMSGVKVTRFPRVNYRKIRQTAAGNQFTQALTGSVGFTGILSRKTKKVLGGSVGYTGILARKTNKQLSGAVGYSGVLAKKTKKLLSGDVSFSGLLATKKLFQKALTAAVSFVGTLATVFIPGGPPPTEGGQLKGIRRRRR